MDLKGQVRDIRYVNILPTIFFGVQGMSWASKIK